MVDDKPHMKRLSRRTGFERPVCSQCQEQPMVQQIERPAHLIMARMSALLGYVCTVSCATWNGVNTRRHAVSMNCEATQ